MEETFGADDLGSSAYRAYSDQRANDYRSMANDLTSSPIFQGMDDETRDKVLKAAYDLADKSALADHSDGQYEVSTKWMAQADDAEAQGIEPWEYVLFHTAYNEMEGTKDADGKTVKGEAKSDHVREWLEDFSGLTDEQRAFLWGTVYTSEWDKEMGAGHPCSHFFMSSPTISALRVPQILAVFYIMRPVFVSTLEHRAIVIVITV